MTESRVQEKNSLSQSQKLVPAKHKKSITRKISSLTAFICKSIHFDGRVRFTNLLLIGFNVRHEL